MSVPPLPSDGAGALVLVADDVEANVELLRDQLAVLGVRVISAADGPEALARATAEGPDCCILDVSMPAGDLGVDPRETGFEVCRRLKRDPRTARIPVIFVSALNDGAVRLKAIEAGGDDFLLKPHDRHVLGARVRSLLRLKGATDALEQSLLELREAQQAREDLVRMIVHDLKTPLTAVLATLEMLRDGDFGAIAPEPARALSDVESQAEDLLGLIQDLLDVSRVSEQTLALQPEPIAPGALMAELVHDWAVRFHQEQATARTAVEDDAPVFEADKTLLKRVLSNLIQNAVTHSATPVTVTLGARREAEGIHLTVADDGPGIPPAFQDRIFRKFEQVRGPHAPRVRSSGLGLAFCRIAVESHGGRIWVESEEGQGSIFHLRLPLTPAPPRP
ncbi:MAG: hybrid sensor histidine kinase/response regulator [Gemmatimonadota bacterium]|jgi:signal transduction histidine kinase|nr:hybrid sensor histidine kinase/response regulator [Gemmatimonadota bacterium]MDQ8147162.1 hybrid sensor histidine kinase/response regulator [Gemmatimonadota bacterium]MDQ8149555.1 hybrid sensor histidine kinase/response regulator [Gemmatimonadota bacterium]MDQ8156494.1 hybrid sensor histidine kinase/response regulator [Gemmatimonadota bacterium]MDQ8176491.1 hybrid sensor histidine kinase/response regulator [Gemmatimonadota bacterium]